MAESSIWVDGSPLSSLASSPSPPESPVQRGRRPSQAPPSPPTSSTIPPPPPLKLKPRLEDFIYGSKHFPAEAPEITPDSSPLDVTISVISTMLKSEENDVALGYMLDHQVVQRLFAPRQVVKGSEIVPAEYKFRHQYSASAMAWYILDPGSLDGPCPSCLNDRSQGPFEECLVPIEPRAEGACTNCFFKGRSAHCRHRIAKEEIERQRFANTFKGFRRSDLVAATDNKLTEWATCLRAELLRRDQRMMARPFRRRKEP